MKKIWLIVVGLSIFCFLIGCKKEKQKYSNAEGSTNPNVQPEEKSPPKPNLGGGYKGIKWGSTKKEVIKSLNMNPDSVNKYANEDDLIFTFGEKDSYAHPGKKLTCSFYNGKFCMAGFIPGFKNGDERGAEAILEMLTAKFGEGTKVDGYTDDYAHEVPLLTYMWDDGETRIMFQMWDPTATAEIFKRSVTTYYSSTLKVFYMCKSMVAQYLQEEEESKEKSETKMRNQRKQKFKNDF